MTIKGEKLAFDIWTAVIGLFTVANGYAIATGWPKAAAAMDSNSLNKLRTAASVARFGSDRVLVVNAAYDGQLGEDNALKLALNIGNTDLMQGGALPRKLYGFDYFENPELPDNGVNLAGYIANQAACLIATAPIPPVEEVRRSGTMYSMAVDPVTGATIEYRSFGSNTLDRGERYIEANYGKGVGNASALQMLTSA